MGPLVVISERSDAIQRLDHHVAALLAMMVV
jgi:hypothetical protein